jgi:hypothetical protein
MLRRPPPLVALPVALTTVPGGTPTPSPPSLRGSRPKTAPGWPPCSRSEGKGAGDDDFPFDPSGTGVYHRGA